MIISSINNPSELNMIKAKVELYNGSTLVTTCTCADVLSDFSISREGESGKFFGFGVCHKLDMNLIDLYKVLDLHEGFTASVCLGDGEVFDCPYPKLTLTDVLVDKKSGDIKLTAYDAIYKASELVYKDLGITAPYTLRELTGACAALLGVNMGELDSAFDLSYSEGGNFDEDTPIRDILNDIAEITQTIYYINKDNKLTFKRLSNVSVAEYNEHDYYEFETAESKVLKGVGSATELGDNYKVEDPNIAEGVTQFIRNNGLLELREDITLLLEDALNRVKGTELCQYDLDWSGDYLLEIGDAITVHSGEESILLYILNDVIHYAGTLNEISSWEYGEGESETFANPTNIGDKINQTFAKVDKIEKNITLYVSEVAEDIVNEKTAELTVKVDGISAEVTSVQQIVTSNSIGLQQEINELSKRVDASVTDSDVTLQISRALANGVNRVETTTGFTFDEQGLRVSKTGSDLESLLDENGLEVSRYDTPVLEARSNGVNALNVNVRQFLQIGGSRIEAFGSRTGCFWIGE
jgi:hypothetical protein